MEAASERHRMTGQSLDYSSMRREEDRRVWGGLDVGAERQKESRVHSRLAVVKRGVRHHMGRMLNAEL